MCLFYHLFFLRLQRDHDKSMSYMRCKQLLPLQRCLGVYTMWTLQPRFPLSGLKEIASCRKSGAK